MRLEQAKNARRNIAVGIAGKVITMVLSFAVRTVIIYVLGAEYLGLNSLFSSVFQVLNLSELGFGSAIVYSMYKPIAENDSDTICALLGLYRRAYRIIGLFILGVGLLFLPFLDRLISGSPPEGVSIYPLYGCYLLYTVLGYFLFDYRSSLLYAYQRPDVLSTVSMLSLSSTYLIQMAVLIGTKNYTLYLFWLPFFALWSNLSIGYLTYRMFPQYVCRGKISPELFGDIKKQVYGLMVARICHTTRNSFDNIFISAFLGLTLTAMYGNYYYILNAVLVLLAVISNAVSAGIGNRMVLDTPQQNYAMMRKLNFAYMWVAGWCSICMAGLYQPFMELWVGKELTFSYEIMVAFCVYFYVYEMGTVRSLYAEAAGLWWQNRHLAVAEALANLMLNYLLVRLLGVLGIILATTISLFLINFCMSSRILFRFYFKEAAIAEFFLEHARYAAVTLGAGMVTCYVDSRISLPGVAGFLGKGCVCAVVPNLCYLIVYCRTALFRETLPWLLRQLKVRR